MYFILYTQWKKIDKNMTRWRHKTLAAWAIRKQVSRCCINFPHELTRQILSNQSIKLGRRARPTRDHSENSQKRLPKPAGFSPPRSVEIKILIVPLMNTTKNEFEPAIIWKVVTCQRIVSKNTRTQWVDAWARDMVRRY